MAVTALRDAWSQRSAGERRVLGALALGVVAIMVLALVWLPLERERTRLREALPAQRASIATLEAQGHEALRLRAMPVASIATGTPLASLATNAGGLPGASITVLDSRRVRVSGADVGFASLLDWLRGAQITHGMRVDTAHLEALPVRGRVRVELLLAKD
jgi:type II secretory pathway component PulM